jgi:hypothetical protein
MASVVPDIIDQSTIVRTFAGCQIVRRLLVTDISVDATDPNNSARYQLEALTATGVPAFGSFHPLQSCYGNVIGLSPAMMFKVVPIPKSKNSVFLDVTYDQLGYTGGGAPPYVWMIQNDGVLVSEQIDFDYSGKGLTVPWDPSISAGDTLTGAAVNVPVGTNGITALKPYRTITATQSFLNTVAIETYQDTYLGYTNSDTYRGKPPGTWLCTKVSGITYNNGFTRDLTYQLVYKPVGWKIGQIVLLAGDFPINNAYVSTDPTKANAYAQFTIYGSTPFSELGF